MLLLLHTPDVGLQDLAKGCSTLKSLSLYWNVKYTDVGISAIVRSLTPSVAMFLNAHCVVCSSMCIV